MRFSEQAKRNVIQFRVTDAEHAFLGEVAQQKGMTVAGVIRTALDAWLAAQPASDSSKKRAPKQGRPK
jgi:hypothetical protein